jgi:Xaa-Pro aminopeptidase
MHPLPPELLADLPRRHDRLRAALAAAHADALILTLNADLVYASGTVFSGWFYLPAAGNPVFFFRRPSDFPARIPGFEAVAVRRPDQMAEHLAATGRPLPMRLLLEGDELPAAEWFQFARIFPGAELLNGSPHIRLARAVKTGYELDRMRLSCRLHAETIATFPALFRPGMTDLDFSIAMEHAIRRRGSLGLFRAFGGRMELFMGSVLAGDNARTPSAYDFALGGEGLDPAIPVGANGAPLTPGTTVMADIGGNFTGYISDCSRTYAIGAIPAAVREAHQVSIAICEALAAAARPGVRCDSLYALALKQAEAAGLAPHFMGFGQQAKFVGHGIGIEINELPVLAPRSDAVLEANMVVALEPKFVFPGVGAVGIENTYAVTAAGLEKLTCCDESLVTLA